VIAGDSCLIGDHVDDARAAEAETDEADVPRYPEYWIG
jgi:hypothetical protein